MSSRAERRASKQATRIRKRLRQVLVDAAGHHLRWSLKGRGFPLLNLKSDLWSSVRWPRSLRGSGKEVGWIPLREGVAVYRYSNEPDGS